MSGGRSMVRDPMIVVIALLVVGWILWLLVGPFSR